MNLLPRKLRLGICFLWFGLSLAGISPRVAAESLGVSGLAVLSQVMPDDTISTVSAPDRQAQFQALNDVYLGGYTTQARWLRFTVEVPSPGAWWLELQPAILDDIRLYVPEAGGFAERRAGDTLPFTAREEGYRSFVFKLELADLSPGTYYLRLASTSTLMAQLRLWRPAEFSRAKYAEYAIASFVNGVLFVIFLMNLFLWYYLRINVIAWFSLHVLANLVLVVFSSGFVSQFVLPDNPALANTLSHFTLAFLLSASAPFFMSLVLPRMDHPWLRAFLWGILVAPQLFVLSVFVDLYSQATKWMLICSLPVYVLTLALVTRLCLQQGLKEFYLLIGFLLTLIGGVVTTLVMLGWLNVGLLPVNSFRPTPFGLIVTMQIGIFIRIHAISAERQQATERALRAELQVSSERRALTEQGRFIGMITHELKTPLAVIDASTQALARLTKSDNQAAIWRYDRIQRAVRRIERLVDQFLTADKVDNIQGPLLLSHLDVVKLLHGVAESSLCEPDRLKIQVPEKLTLLADAAHLRLALSNLVDNALKYSPPHSPIGLSAQSCHRNGAPGVEIMVTDEGPGVPDDELDKIFTRYKRGADVGHIPGAGLGLYLVRRIVEKHHGHVHCLPRAGEGGGAFNLWLPNEPNLHNKGMA